MKTHKVEQLIIATVGFFWCFLMWFSTAAFSPSIAAHYHLSIKALGLLAKLRDLDGANRPRGSRMGLRSFRRPAHIRRDPCRLRPRLDRLGLHTKL